MCSEARFCITLSLVTFITVQSPIFTFRARCWGSRSRGSYIPDVSLFSVFCFFFRRGAVFLKLYSLQFVFLLFFSSFLLFVIQDNYFYFKVSSRTQLFIFFIAKLLKNSEQQDFKKVFGYLFFIIFCLFFSENKITFDSN